MLILCAVFFVIALLASLVAWMVLTDAADEEQKRLEQSNRD
jgi:hypothetical protein